MYPFIIEDVKHESGLGRVVEKKFVEKTRQVSSADKSSDDAPSYGPGYFINQEIENTSTNKEIVDRSVTLDDINKSFKLHGLNDCSTIYDKNGKITETYHGKPLFSEKG